MRPTLTVDTRQWQQAANDLFKTSSRSCVDFINGQSLKVASEAIKQTESANRAQIAAVLGATGNAVKLSVSTRGKRKGQLVARRGGLLVRENSFAARILGKRFKDTGKWGVKGETMEERVRNFITARMRSVAFIKSGWIPALRILSSVVRKKPSGVQSSAGARQVGQPKGSAKPATFSLRSIIESQITNTALKTESRAPATGGDPMPVAVAGLRKALAVASADMIKKLAERLDPDFRRFSAGRR